MTKPKSFLRQFFAPWGLWALMTLAACAFSLTLARIEAANVRHLADEGAEAMATVTGLNMTTTRSNNRTQHHFEVSFQFTVDGQTHDGKQIVSEDFFRRLKTRDQIPVRYWTRDLSLTEIEPGNRAVDVLIGQIVAGVAGALTLIFAALGWRWAHAASWMVRNGAPREGTVTRLVGHWFTTFGKMAYLRAHWSLPGGEGRSRLHSLKTLPKVGSTITVLVDPQGRRPGIWDGDL